VEVAMQRLSFLFRDRSLALAASRASLGAGLPRPRIEEARHVRGLVARVRSTAPEGALIGTIVGATCGALNAFVAFVVPDAVLGMDGLMHLVRAGAIAGGVVGLHAGLAIGLSKPDPQARRYAKAAMAEGVVVSVDAEDAREAKRAKKIFKRQRAIELAMPTQPSRLRRPFDARPLPS
jgi:hypothetical protein